MDQVLHRITSCKSQSMFKDLIAGITQYISRFEIVAMCQLTIHWKALTTGVLRHGHKTKVGGFHNFLST